MSSSSGHWITQAGGSVDDPLKEYRKRPVISREGPHATYVGRVIIELYADDRGASDADNIAMTVGAVDGQHDQLLDRVAKVLVARLQQKNLLDPTP